MPKAISDTDESKARLVGELGGNVGRKGYDCLGTRIQTQYPLAGSSPAPGAQCIITSSTAVEGLVSFAMVRGKNILYL